MAGLHSRRSVVLSARAVPHRCTGSQVYLRRAAARGITRRMCGGLQRGITRRMCGELQRAESQGVCGEPQRAES